MILLIDSLGNCVGSDAAFNFVQRPTSLYIIFIQSLGGRVSNDEYQNFVFISIFYDTNIIIFIDYIK